MKVTLQTHKLVDIADVIRGVTFGRSDGQTTPTKNHLPVLRAGNIQDRLILEKDLVWVPQSKISKNQLIKQNDIVMCTSSGSAAIVGKCAMSESDWDGSFGAFCIGIRPKNAKCIPSYLLHYLHSPFFTNWSKRSSGANIKNIRKSELEDFSIPLPPLAEQKRIATILDKADAIRRKRQAAIKLADDFLRATFLDMFGDPVTNPKGWEVKPFGEHVISLRYGTGSPPPYQDLGVPFIRATNIKEGTIQREGMRFISEKDFAKIIKCKVNSGDLIIVRSGVNTGDCAIVPEQYDGACAAYDIIMTLPYEKAIFYNYIINSRFGKHLIEPLTRRAAQPHLNADQIKSLMFISPPERIISQFCRTLVKIGDTKKRQNIHKGETCDLFNSLTQRAFRGEL